MSKLRDDTVLYNFKVLIHEDELDQIAGWVFECPDRETGGDLFGFWTHSGAPSVQFVLGPGPQARHQVAAFYQDRDYLGDAGAHAQRLCGLQHIGEWHSHHQMGLATPSSGDTGTLELLFERYNFPRFLLCIANICPVEAGQDDCAELNDGVRLQEKCLRFFQRSPASGRNSRFRVEIGAFLFHRNRREFQRGLWVVLPDRSPVAQYVRRTAGIAAARRPSQAWVVSKTTLDRSFGVASAPPQGWYTQPWGTAFLRDFDDRCRRTYGDCRMQLDSGSGFFTYTFAAGSARFEIRFPAEFPKQDAVIDAADGSDLAGTPIPYSCGAGTFFERVAAAVMGASVATVGEAETTQDKGGKDELERAAEEAPRAGEADPEGVLPKSRLAQPD